MAQLLYMSRRRVAAGEWTFDATVDGATVNNMAIPAGAYYLDAPIAADSLVAQVVALLEANFAPENFTGAVDETTGRVTLSCSTLATTWALSCDQQSLADWLGGLGWAASASSSQTAPDVAQGLVYPNSGREQWARKSRDFGTREVLTRSGILASVSTDSEIVKSSWRHSFEPDAKSGLYSGTWDTAGNETAWAWEDFFRHHASGAQCGQPFRFYDDAADLFGVGGGPEGTYVLQGAARFAPSLLEPESLTYWAVELSVAGHVE